MVTKVIVNGAKGKMGALACDMLKKHREFDLVAQLKREDNLAQIIADTNADIVVELTNAESVFNNSLTIIKQGARPVIGASGLLQKEVKELSSLCESRQLGCIIAPNFSIGAVLMMLFAAKAAQYMSEVEIIEAHHQQKIDAPSGTSLKTAEMINAARKNPKNTLTIKELVPGALGGMYNEVPIHSLRLPGILAQQHVLFGNTGETLSIVHNSIDRNCFMPGVVLACQKVMGLKNLVYGLEHLI